MVRLYLSMPGLMLKHIFAESSPASKAQWLRPNCHNSLCIQRELLSSCRRNSRYRLPHHPIRFDSLCSQRHNKGTCWCCLRCHFVTRDTESKLGDPGAKWEPCRDTATGNRHIDRTEQQSVCYIRVRGRARQWKRSVWEEDVRGTAPFARRWLNQGMLSLEMKRRGSNGSWKPNKVELIAEGLKGVPAALERLTEGKASGLKLVTRPQETPADQST